MHGKEKEKEKEKQFVRKGMGVDHDSTFVSFQPSNSI